MSVDTSGRPSGESVAADAPERSDPAGASDGGQPRRPSALQRVAGAIPEGTQVEQSLDRFIDQVHSSLVHARGWSVTEEQAAREREDAARRAEEARLAALSAAKAAAAAADTARATAEAEAARARDDERRASQRMAVLEARLAEAEKRAAAAEQRAIDPDPDDVVRTATLRDPRRRGPVLLSAAIAIVGVAIAAVLLSRDTPGGIDDDRGPPPTPAKAAPQPRAEAAPEPVIRSMMPAEPTVKPLMEKRAVRPGKPPRPRPAGAKPVRKPARGPAR